MAEVRRDDMSRRELLIGCGSERTKRLNIAGHEEWEGLVTLDINPDHKPDVVWNLEQTSLPFPTDDFDEIHAYEVLEHTGQQGDWRFFFDQWSEFWRILKPGGLFFATVPMWNSQWAWGDPSHKRVITWGNLAFLNQDQYRENVGRTPMSDFRFCYKADFTIGFAREEGETFKFALVARKPSTWSAA